MVSKRCSSLKSAATSLGAYLGITDLLDSAPGDVVAHDLPSKVTSDAPRVGARARLGERVADAGDREDPSAGGDEAARSSRAVPA